MKKNFSFSLYIHIPWCKKKCFYCDFVSYKFDENLIDKYLIQLAKEMQFYKNSKISTIFIGGGTPSVLSLKQFDFLLNSITKNFNISKLNEFTIEANPESLDIEKIKFLKHTNLIDRISLGLQALDNNVLKKIGRLHTLEDFENVYENLLNNGFSNISADLIAGWDIFHMEDTIYKDYDKNFPNYLDDFLKRFQFLKHLSLYLLNFENTKVALNFDEQVDLYFKAIQVIKNNGFIHYEISNFAKNNRECKHNLAYWNRAEYIGLGVSASGFLGNTRYKNSDKLDEYFEFAGQEKEVLTEQNILSEELMLGLRLLNQGIDYSKFYDKKMQDWIDNGFLKLENNRIFLTDKGIPISNQIFSYFV